MPGQLEVVQVKPIRNEWLGTFRLFVKGPDGRSRVPRYTDELPSAGSFDDEYAYNIDTDKYNPNWLKLNCPHCGRRCSPFMTPFHVLLEYGWRWVGLEYKEPFAEYQARCPGCHEWYRFTTYTPQ